MRDRWAALRAAGQSAIELSPDGRQRLRNAARRTMRMCHRKRQALEWGTWMLRQQADWTIRMWSEDRQRVILHPYLQTLKDFGDGAFFELAEIAGFGDLRKTQDGTDLAAKILARYRPRLDIRAAAEDLRKGAKAREGNGVFCMPPKKRARARLGLSATNAAATNASPPMGNGIS